MPKRRIKGNIQVTIQTQTSTSKNAIGEKVPMWGDTMTAKGWLGLSTGGADRSNYNVKLEESTHIFLMDYSAALYALRDTDCRMIAKGVMYDVLLIDNPDEMDEQLEIYLRRVGAAT